MNTLSVNGFTMLKPWSKQHKGRKLLKGDNLSSNFCPEVIKKCEQNDIAFVCLPKNSTHLTQPLDVTVFASIQRVWQQVRTEWKLGDGKNTPSLPKDQFPSVIKKMLENITPNLSKTIKNSYLKQQE